MSINRKSSSWRIAARLALAVLLADVAGAAALHPSAGAGLFADLARICRADGDPSAPAQPDGAQCVFCLPLAGGTAIAPAEVALPVPGRAGHRLDAPVGAAFHARANVGAHLPRGPPTV